MAPNKPDDLPPPVSPIMDSAQLDDATAGEALPESGQMDAHGIFVQPYTEPSADEMLLSKAVWLKRLLIERVRRQTEALRLYEPLHQEAIDFHKSRSNERLVRGSNRAGKTLAAAAEVSRAVTGLDPYDKYPKTDGRWVCVGLSEEHCGQVMYRKLFKPGAFRIIKENGKWRTCRNWREIENRNSKPAPALIPPRHVKNISWVEKKREIPRRIVFHNGWEMTFFSSKADPPQGWDIDGWWIDEECQNETWYPELSARTLDRGGCGMWSATPQVANQQLYDMHIRAEEYHALTAAGAKIAVPEVSEHVMLLKANPCISPTEIYRLKEKLTEEEQRVRIGGEFAITSFKVYPDYDKGIHNCDYFPIPGDWAHFLIVDPGRQICGVLFGTVPPPREKLKHPHCYIYDELYIKDCTAEIFGQMVRLRAPGRVFDTFVIDWRAARVTEMASGVTVERQYSLSLRRHGVQSRQGYVFVPGGENVKAGIEAVRDWLRCRVGAKPYLQVFRDRCPKLEWEVARYHYKRIRMIPTDEPEGKNDHLMDCLRYLAMHQPTWRKPKKVKPMQSDAVRSMQAKLKRKNKGEDNYGVQLGPVNRSRSRGR